MSIYEKIKKEQIKGSPLKKIETNCDGVVENKKSNLILKEPIKSIDIKEYNILEALLYASSYYLSRILEKNKIIKDYVIEILTISNKEIPVAVDINDNFYIFIDTTLVGDSGVLDFLRKELPKYILNTYKVKSDSINTVEKTQSGIFIYRWK